MTIMKKENNYSLKYLLIIPIVGGLCVLFNNVYWSCFFLLFLVPVFFIISNNLNKPTLLFRYLLLLVFPITLYFSFGEIMNCADDWLFFEILLIIVISLLLMKGKRMNLGLIFKVYYIFALIFLLFGFGFFSGASSSTPDAKIKATMSQMRSAAYLSKLRVGSYAGVRNDEDFNVLMRAVYDTQKGLSSHQCILNRPFNWFMAETKPYDEGLLVPADGSAWCYKVELKMNPISWCVDSNGYAGHADEGGCVGENYSCKVVGL